MMRPLRATTFFMVFVMSAVGAPGQSEAKREFFVEEAVQYFPQTFDPHHVTNPYYLRCFRPVYESLLECDPTSPVLTIRPGVLEFLPTLDETSTIITLRLRSAVTFQDDACFEGGKGRAATTDDIIAVIQRIADPATRSPFWGSYVAGHIKGLDAVRAEAEQSGRFDYAAPIAGLDAVSGQVLRIHLTAPYPQLPALMTMPFLAPIPREAIRFYGSALSERMVGTGPYIHDRKASKNGVLIFNRNPKYWNAAAGGKLGKLPLNDGIKFYELEKIELHEQRFTVGDLTFLDLFPSNQDDFVTWRGDIRRKVRPRKSTLVFTDLTQVHYVGFNLKNKILAKKKVRQALALGMDREAWVKGFYKGAATIADHLVPPSLPLDTPRESYPWPLAKKDLKRARRLLAEAGHPGGEGMPEFVFDLPSKQKLELEQVKRLVASWKRIGVNVQIRPNTFAEFMARQRKGLCEISSNYWFADYPDPENFFLMLYSKNAPHAGATGDLPNVVHYDNPAYDRAYEAACKLPAGEARGRLFGEMIRLFQDDCPWIPIAHQARFTVVTPAVVGLASRSAYAFAYPWIRRAR